MFYVVESNVCMVYPLTDVLYLFNLCLNENKIDVNK